MHQNKNFNTIANAFRRGEIQNAGLNARLVKYKRLERNVMRSWAGKRLSASETKEYKEDVSNLTSEWVDLIVDVACFKGVHLDKNQVTGIRELLSDSLADYVGNV